MKKEKALVLILVLTLVIGLTGSLGYRGASAEEPENAVTTDSVKDEVARQIKKYKGCILTSKKQYRNNTLPLIDGYMNNLVGYSEAAYDYGYKGYGEGKLNSFQQGYDDCLQTAADTLERYVAREFIVNSSDARGDAKRLINMLSELPDGSVCYSEYERGKADKERDVEIYIESLPLGNYITDGSVDYYSLFTSYKLAGRYAVAFNEVPLGSRYTGKKHFHLYNADGSIKEPDFYSSKECFAHAEFLDNYVFRADHLGRDGNSVKVLENVSINRDTVCKGNFDKAGVRPGASIRVTNSEGGHSLTLIGYTDSRVVFADCNSSQVDGYCTVRICVTDWAAFRKYISYNGRKIYTVCVKKNYDSYVENL